MFNFQSVSSVPLLLQIPKTTFQEDSLHDFSKENSGAEQPMVSQIILLTGVCSICLPLLCFSVLSGILQWYQAAFSASSDAAHLALCTCMDLELPTDT